MYMYKILPLRCLLDIMKQKLVLQEYANLFNLRRDMNRDQIKVRKYSFQIICMTNVAITTSKHVMKLHLKDDESKGDIYSTK